MITRKMPEGVVTVQTLDERFRIFHNNLKVIESLYPELLHYISRIEMEYLRHMGRSQLMAVDISEALSHVRSCQSCWKTVEEKRDYLCKFVFDLPEIDKYKLF